MQNNANENTHSINETQPIHKTCTIYKCWKRWYIGKQNAQGKIGQESPATSTWTASQLPRRACCISVFYIATNRFYIATKSHSISYQWPRRTARGARSDLSDAAWDGLIRWTCGHICEPCSICAASTLGKGVRRLRYSRIFNNQTQLFQPRLKNGAWKPMTATGWWGEFEEGSGTPQGAACGVCWKFCWLSHHPL